MSQNSDSCSYESNEDDQKITCEGCLYDAPGQRHHMGVGGCLEVSYFPDADIDQYFPYQDYQSQNDQTTISESD